MKNQKLIAFWKYDLCPYMLCGEVEKFTDKGNIVAKGYAGMTFKPIAIIPGEAGEYAAEQLSNLKTEYRIAERALKDTYIKRAKKLIGLV